MFSNGQQQESEQFTTETRFDLYTLVWWLCNMWSRFQFDSMRFTTKCLSCLLPSMVCLWCNVLSLSLPHSLSPISFVSSVWHKLTCVCVHTDAPVNLRRKLNKSRAASVRKKKSINSEFIGTSLKTVFRVAFCKRLKIPFTYCVSMLPADMDFCLHKAYPNVYPKQIVNTQ